MEPTKFDDLTKALATSTSRRQALKTIAATTLGSILGLSGIGTAFGKNKTCAQWCAAVFGDNTPAAKQCTSDAAHGTGLCQTCGSATPTSSICCTRNASGFCSSYSPTLPCACPSGQTCQNGTCSVCANPASEICNAVPGSCGVSGCFCVKSVEGGVYCADDYVCGGGVSCAADSDCVAQFGSDYICMNEGSCGCTGTGTTCVHISASPATCFTGCFIAGTLIAMADGTSRPIEHVLVGDLVLGNAGRVNRVSEVLLPMLGQRPLYALNKSNYFVTAGHPFMTEEGWKAVDPNAVPAQLSDLRAGRLTVGDRLLTLTTAAIPVGGGRASRGDVIDVRIETIALQGLVSQPADPATQLYNLRLDGDHTYFANDLLVHNK